jgi:hypothetical protein
LKSITDDMQEGQPPELTGSSPGGLRERLERYERSAGGGIQAVLDDPTPEPGIDAEPAPTTEAEEPISPELALIDPELAVRRAQLPDAQLLAAPPEEFEPSSNRIVLPDLEPLTEPERLRESEAPSGKRRVARNAVGLGVLAAAVAAIAYTVLANEPVRTASSRPPAPVASSRAFVWAPAHGAASYLFQLYRGETEIFRARPTEARIVVPAHWLYESHRLSFQPGRYRWSVWPRLRGGRLGQPIVLSKLVVQRSASGGGESTRSP